MYIEKYLEIGTDSNEVLFVSLIKPYNRLKISEIEIRIRQLGKEVNVSKVYPHKFRRTMVTIENMWGKNIEIIDKQVNVI